MLFPSPGVVEISQRDQPFASRRLSHKRGDEASTIARRSDEVRLTRRGVVNGGAKVFHAGG